MWLTLWRMRDRRPRDWLAQAFRSFGLLEVTRIRQCTSLRWTGSAPTRWSSVKRRLSVSVDCLEGMSTLLWASAARDIGNFCMLSASMLWSNLEKRPGIIVESLLSGRRIETNASSSTRAFQTLLSRRRIWSRSPRDNPSHG